MIYSVTYAYPSLFVVYRLGTYTDDEKQETTQRARQDRIGPNTTGQKVINLIIVIIIIIYSSFVSLFLGFRIVAGYFISVAKFSSSCFLSCFCLFKKILQDYGKHVKFMVDVEFYGLFSCFHSTIKQIEGIGMEKMEFGPL